MLEGATDYILLSDYSSSSVGDFVVSGFGVVSGFVTVSGFG